MIISVCRSLILASKCVRKLTYNTKNSPFLILSNTFQNCHIIEHLSKSKLIVIKKNNFIYKFKITFFTPIYY